MAAVAAATTTPDGLGGGMAAAPDKEIKIASTDMAAASQVHTPPETDETSHSHKDDDAASSSSLSELGDEMDLVGDILGEGEAEEGTSKFEEAARAGAEAEQFSEVKPDRYEGGIPIFQPTMEEFKDFQRYVKGVDPYGMQSGIVLIDPPEEWKRARKALDEMVKTIKIKNPLTQEFHGAQGIYTQRNMEKMRSYNLPQWKAICESTENQPPAKRGEKRLNADKLLGRGTIKTKKADPLPLPDGVRRKAGRPRVKPIKEEITEKDSTLLAPPTPTSPETKPAVPLNTEDTEAEDTADPTPTKGRGKQPTPKPKGRQPKTANRRESTKGGGKGAETTVASRRLHNAREAANEVDEEAFKDFDYRVYDNDQWTAERCDELEEKYWKSLNFSNPMYAADMPGSLFDEDTKEWNVAKLPNLLDLLGQPIPGVNTAYLYLGMWRATFAWHLEDVDLYSINYIHFGAPKQWYSISQKDAPKFENAMKSIWTQDAKNCDQFLRHKTYLVSPSLLKSKYGVTVNKIVHREGQFIITFPIGYHSGYNLGYNCAESVNFAIENWLDYGKTSKKCQCEADSVFIDVDWFIRRMNGEPTPEYEEIEVTDDEDDDGSVMNLPTPPGSDRGKVKMTQKRKRGLKDLGPNKKVKKMIKIRKISKNQPCCLCPNDFAYEELLPTSHGQKAHRRCALYTPETYIATKDGSEKVFNVENISKDRLELKCNECRQKKGSCFQCSSAKCTRAYHATCAAQAGVQVDIGEIAVWHEGVEYRDVGLDWRCRMHRTVKRVRVSTELAASNYAAAAVTPEFQEYLGNLKPRDLIQWQVSNADDIEAGVVIHRYDPRDGYVMVKVLPEQNDIREIDPASLLFVDSSTSCLQKPSANALDLPEELQGMTASMPDSSEKKPSPGDKFTEGTEWSEFTSAQPAKNKAQKRVDFSKPKKLWHYLGKTSTESKAQYTTDPARPIHDPASNFLDTVEPPKPLMAPPPQPQARRQSLAASYPTTPMINMAARNAAMAVQRQHMLERAIAQQKGIPMSMDPHAFNAAMKASTEQMFDQQRHMRIVNPAHFQDTLAHNGNRSNGQQILARQQQKAQQLDRQDRPYMAGSPNIGIDRESVERQRQFQQLAAQQSRSLNQNSSDPALPHLRQYHAPLPNYYAMDAATSNTPSSESSGGRPGVQFTNSWMESPGASMSPNFTSQGSPSMNGTKTASPHMMAMQSPTLSTGRPYSPYSPQMGGQQPMYNGPSPPPPSGQQIQAHAMSPAATYEESMRIRGETNRIESIRAAMANGNPNQHTSPMTPLAINTSRHEHQRRISNPAYPFKSPERLKAQKEAEKNSPPGSRPGSSAILQNPFPLTSPRMKQEPGSNFSRPRSSSAFSHHQSPDMSTGFEQPTQMPQFINPNATQISPPGSAGGYKAASQSFGPMMHPPIYGPPIPPWMSQSMSNLNAALPELPAMDGGLNIHLSAPQKPAVRAVARPSDKLLESLKPRERMDDDGRFVNDQPVPAAWSELANRGQFWDRVAGYFVQRHRGAVNVYRSPYAKPGAGEGLGLAGEFYRGLDREGKDKIDAYTVSVASGEGMGQ